MTPQDTINLVRNRIADYKQYEAKLLAHTDRKAVRERVRHFFEGYAPELKSLARMYPEHAKLAQFEIDRINNILAKYEEQGNGIK